MGDFIVWAVIFFGLFKILPTFTIFFSIVIGIGCVVHFLRWALSDESDLHSQV